MYLTQIADKLGLSLELTKKEEKAILEEWENTTN